MNHSDSWVTVCQIDDLVDNSGVCALINDQQVAIFKLNSANDEQVVAFSNWDPIGKANVMYRGLVGSIDNKTVVASPLYKQRYCVTTGNCVDDETQSVTVYAARIVDKSVQLKIAG